MSEIYLAIWYDGEETKEERKLKGFISIKEAVDYIITNIVTEEDEVDAREHADSLSMEFDQDLMDFIASYTADEDLGPVELYRINLVDDEVVID